MQVVNACKADKPNDKASRYYVGASSGAKSMNSYEQLLTQLHER